MAYFLNSQSRRCRKAGGARGVGKSGRSEGKGGAEGARGAGIISYVQ